MAQEDHPTDSTSPKALVIPPSTGRVRQSKVSAQNILRFGVYLLLALATVVALITSFVGGNRELFQDESYVVWMAISGWKHIAQFIPYEPFPPFHAYVMKVWMDAGGESEIWVRAQPGIFFLVTLGLIWWLGRPIFSRSERLAMIVLMLSCKSLCYFAIFARYFQTLSVASCLVMLSFVGLFTGKLPRWLGLTLLALGNFAGMLTHYYFPFCLLAQGVIFLLFFRWRRLVDFLIGSVLPVLVYAVVWLPTFRRQLQSGRFDDEKTFPKLSDLIADDYFGKRWLIILPGLFLLLLVAHRQGRWRLNSPWQIRLKAAHFLNDQRVRIFATFWATIYFMPYLVSMVVGMQFLKSDPYIVMSSLPFVALVALAINRSDRVLRIVLGLAVLGFVGTIEARARTNAALHPFPEGCSRDGVESMLRKAKPGDIVICLDNYYTKVDYYTRRSKSGVRVEVRGFPKELDLHPGWTNPNVLKDMKAFQAEAVTFASEMSRLIATHPGGRVWVLDCPWRPPFTTVTFAAFDQVMKRTDRIDVPNGVGFTEIVGYEPQ